MSSLFFRQPRLVVLCVLIMISAGMSAFLSIGRQEDPTITNLFATVTAAYPGADPERVESLVTEVLEAQLREIASIAVTESVSASGISIVSIELLETLPNAAIEVAWAEVRDALDDAALELPAGVLPVELSTDGAGTYSSIVALYPSGTVSIAATQRYAENLRDQLRRVSGTEKVELFGSVEEEVLVSVDNAVLFELGISVSQIATAIAQADTKLRAGRVRTQASEFVVELAINPESIEQIRAITVNAVDGSVTRLGDIAAVSQGIREPASEVALVSGQPAVVVATRIGEGLQIDTWMKDVRGVYESFEQVLPDALQLERVFDQSQYTRERLSGVALNMAMGISLVVLVLLLTLGVRAALIVAMILPLVTLASIATLNVLGLAIHQMSLTGLIVALGLLVDAAIVMTDEIRQRLQAGMTRLLAVELSVKRLFAPLLASTVTTALSFMPMVLLPGPSGDFVGSIAIAVIIMLAWSFLIAVTVTAAIAGWLLPDASTAHRPFTQGISATRLTRVFRQSLVLSMRFPVCSVMLALVLPLMGFLSVGTLTAQFFPGVDRNQFHIELELAAGTALSRTQETVVQVDEVLRQANGVAQVSWVIGKSAPAFYYNMVGNKDRAPEFAQALITTTSAQATANLVPDLQKRLIAQFPTARILVRDLVQGPPVNAPVEIRLVGPELATLKTEGDRLRALISSVESVTLVRTSLDGGAPKVTLDIDEHSARLAGLSLAGIARQLDTTLEGSTGGSLLQGTEQLPIRVRVHGDFQQDIAAIGNLPLIPEAGSLPVQSVPLSAIADLQLQPAQSAISRRNGERVNTVQAFLRYGVLPEEALKQVQHSISEAGFELPPGYRLQTGGDSDARDNTLNNLFASLGIIITLSIGAVVITFNSFRLAIVTFMVAGLSAGLSLLALALFQYPFGITAVIGVIGSIGVSINAAIVILTGLQNHQRAGEGHVNSMVDVIMGCSRHIISTTVTTFGGFLPLILAGGGFWPPFAMSIAGGVLLSTVVSFYFTPPMFKLAYSGNRPSRAVPAVEDLLTG